MATSTISKLSAPFSTTSRLVAQPPKTLTFKPLFSASPNIRRLATAACTRSSNSPTPADSYGPRFHPKEHRQAANLLIKSLEEEGVTDVFTYHGGLSKEINKALTGSKIITTHLCPNGKIETATDEYTRSTGRPGVIIAITMPPNIYLPINYVSNIPQDIKMLLSHASTNTPRPYHGIVLNHIRIRISCIHRAPTLPDLEQILQLISKSRKPVLCIGGDCSDASDGLRRFVKLTRIPVTSSPRDLDVYPTNGELSLKVFGKEGTHCANYALQHSDLLIVFGSGFDIGELKASNIVQIDFRPSTMIGENKQPNFSIYCDINLALKGMIELIEESGLRLDFSAWMEELHRQKKYFPLGYIDAIVPQYAIQVLGNLSNGEAIIGINDEQLKMWVAQDYNFNQPDQLVSCSGLLMRYGHKEEAKPGHAAVYIDYDGSFQMHIKELTRIRSENIPVKFVIFNKDENYPDLVGIAKACGIPGARVTKKQEVREAIRKMLEMPGPYLLDVIVPHHEHFLKFDV